MANNIRGPGAIGVGLRGGFRRIGSPSNTDKTQATPIHTRSVNRWRGTTSSTSFNRSITSPSDNHLPLLVPLRATVTITAVLGEVDVAGLLATAVVSSYPSINITARLSEVDVSGLAASVTYLYATVNVTARLSEIDVAGLAATATSLTPITITARLGEIDVSGLSASVDAGSPARSLTPGRLYPLPPGRRLYPILPTGRNTTVG